MKFGTKTCVKYLICFFLVLDVSRYSFSTSEQCIMSKLCELKNITREITQNIQDLTEEEKEELSLLEEEKLLKELWSTAGRFYKKIVEITALYCSGYYPESYTLYDQILLEIGRDVLHIGKILAWYIPSLMSNPYISWKVKVKKCLYITSALVVVAVWLKELYKYNKNRSKRSIYRSYREHDIYDRDYYNIEYDDNLESHPFIR
ncbi:MAG TPA: hypothetical protein VLG50_02755 [Candidatus Saccharimonadales bacterium]|nr:hypothetical protein [Candidatus Saccharimonadales bacterium]